MRDTDGGDDAAAPPGSVVGDKRPSPLAVVDARRVFNLDRPRCNPNWKGRVCTDHPNCVERVKHGMKSSPFWRAIAVQAPAPDLDTTTTSAGAADQLAGPVRGLVNLGATCFFNVFMQCLYFNTTFRQTLYDYRGDDRVLCGMQRLFARLQCTPTGGRVDPTPLIVALGLRVDRQQDVQEFTHLLLTFVRLTMNDVGAQFQGVASHSTRCLRCHTTQTGRRETFTEICLPISPTRFAIDACLAAYLGTERLSGGNRYSCAVCNAKCNAERRLQLHDLPPILHIQLLRFVYNRKAHAKVKLHVAVDIPLALAFERDDDDDVRLYDLTAVILHAGESAHSGHYVAEVRDEHTGRWYNLNDAEIGPGQLVRSAATTRISSDTAYMLVYSRRGRPLVRHPTPSPGLVDEIVQGDRAALLAKQVDAERRAQRVRFITERRAQIAAFFDLCRCVKRASKPKSKSGKKAAAATTTTTPEASFDGSDDDMMVDASWLYDWVRGQEDGRPIRNASLLCDAHGRLDPRRLRDMLRVPRPAWAFLAERYEHDAGVGVAQVCLECAAEVSAAAAAADPPTIGPGKQNKKRARLDDDVVARLRGIAKRSRAFPSQQPPTIARLYLVPYAWLTTMRAWIRGDAPVTGAPHPGPVDASLFCVHGLLGPRVRTPGAADVHPVDAGVVGVTDDDWGVIVEQFGCSARPAFVTLTNREEGRERLARQWAAVACTFDPDLCHDASCRYDAVPLSASTAVDDEQHDTTGLIQVQWRGPRRKSSRWVAVSTTWSLVSLKRAVEQEFGVPADRQVVMSGATGAVFDDDGRALDALGVTLGCTVVVVDRDDHASLLGARPRDDDDDVDGEVGFVGTSLFTMVAEMDAEEERRRLEEERGAACGRRAGDDDDNGNGASEAAPFVPVLVTAELLERLGDRSGAPSGTRARYPLLVDAESCLNKVATKRSRSSKSR
ncbi:Ubiquitin carboxyl-terminal hydrolase [Plasmodiophora brassicae]